MMWIQFGIKDIIDIILVAFILYEFYKLMKNSGTLAVFSGIISVVILWVLVSWVLEMKLLGAIMDGVMSVGVIVLVVLFQDDIRRFLVALGSHRGWNFLGKLFRSNSESESDGKYIAPVVLATMNMARKKTGALIVIRDKMDLSIYEHTGEMINADINARLIENVFFKNSPLHDGAMIISDGRIKAAGCILPVAYNADIPKEMGLRHRSGLGMSIETDAFVIIVSEERGQISVAHKGKLTVNISAEELQQILSGERKA